MSIITGHIPILLIIEKGELNVNYISLLQNIKRPTSKEVGQDIFRKSKLQDFQFDIC